MSFLSDDILSELSAITNIPSADILSADIRKNSPRKKKHFQQISSYNCGNTLL
jgi:hypothetical protein